jgi:hypothetical protein
MKKNFVEELIKTIVDNRYMPKVQVEREFSPILEIFIESVMNELAKKNVIWGGEYKLIASEFPLNNGENNNLRSVNIDYLLVNISTKDLVFVELKTDSHSFDQKQYELYKTIIEKNNSKELYDFLSKLKHPKYKIYKKEIVDKNLKELDLAGFEKVRGIKLIYIAPQKLKGENKYRGSDGKEAIEYIKNSGKFVTFEDLRNHNDITSEFKDEWKIITKHLIELDKN